MDAADAAPGKHRSDPMNQTEKRHGRTSRVRTNLSNRRSMSLNDGRCDLSRCKHSVTNLWKSPVTVCGSGGVSRSPSSGFIRRSISSKSVLQPGKPLCSDRRHASSTRITPKLRDRQSV
jgi:hypothetical protein